jgi:hypothetical protein
MANAQGDNSDHLKSDLGPTVARPRLLRWSSRANNYSRGQCRRTLTRNGQSSAKLQRENWGSIRRDITTSSRLRNRFPSSIEGRQKHRLKAMLSYPLQAVDRFSHALLDCRHHSREPR